MEIFHLVKCRNVGLISPAPNTTNFYATPRRKVEVLEHSTLGLGSTHWTPTTNAKSIQFEMNGVRSCRCMPGHALHVPSCPPWSKSRPPAQTVHVVGDSLGWTIPQSGQQYVTWASANKFVTFLNNSSVFNFATNAHDVQQQVTKASFDSCSSDNAIGSSITTGPANVTLISAGDNYFICTYDTHYQSG
ncbi:unnamed protein product [Prunus brigantina]